MTIPQMQSAIMGVYQTESWREKVMHMPDYQVVAVYHNFADRGILNKVMKTDKPKIKYENPKSEEQYQQLSIFDLEKQL